MDVQYPIEVYWSEEDQAYIAEVYDLPGCLADGATEAEAIAAARESASLWIDVARKQGRDIPAPSAVDPVSGKFLLRLPVYLHRELRDRARREGVSLNQLVIALLAERKAS